MNKKRWTAIFWGEILLIIVCVIMLVTQILKRAEYEKFEDRGVPRINISLNGVSLDEIKANSKETKYGGSEVEIYNEGKITEFDNVEVKGRGNSTWIQPKKPFQLSFNNVVDLFGLGKAKKWVLLANYFDASFMRNDIAFLLAEMLNEKFNSRGKFVEIYFDGEYEGLYYLTHKIEIAKNSVDLREKDGVIFEVEMLHDDQEKFYVSYFGERLLLSDTVLEDQDSEGVEKDFINKINQLEIAIEARNYEKISELMDVESFVKYYLINEFTVNPDAYSSSFYLYKDGKNDKIHAGPVWDFDLALGNRMWFWQIDEKFFSPKETMIREREAFGKDGVKEDLKISKIFYYLMKMPEFKKEVSGVFKKQMSGKKKIFLMTIYSTIKGIESSVLVDQQKWKQGDFGDSTKELLEWIIKRYDYFEQEYGEEEL